MTSVALPDRVHLAVVGLGYVGLPLAVAFGERRPCLGFDIDPERTAELGRGEDSTRELNAEELADAVQLRFSSSEADLADANVYVVTVPTPVDDRQSPEFSCLIEASRTVGRYLTPGDVVVFESTVYPGATEEICIPELEAASGLTLDVDFSAGYSPERINPGDRERRLTDIVKITAASNEAARTFVDELYQSIIRAGTFSVSAIKVAEAAKVVENTQRDLNISLVNELALIFHRLDVDTLEVLKAAGTKWNFLPFRPGLVGGHCIGVDPYYLIHKARQAGYSPDVITAGRRVNDSVGEHIAEWVVRLMIDRGFAVKGAPVLLLGLTFKENTPDIRNTRVVDVRHHLQGWGAAVDVFDPWVDHDEVEAAHGFRPLQALPEPGHYAAVIMAVAHDAFRQWGADGVRRLGCSGSVLFDARGVFPLEEVDARL